MPVSWIGDRNAFAVYIQEKFHDYSNLVGLSAFSSPISFMCNDSIFDKGESLSTAKHYGDLGYLVQRLVSEYEETNSISKLQEIKNVKLENPSAKLPAHIDTLIAELSSYNENVLQELIHQQDLNSSVEVLRKIADIAYSSTDISIPVYILEQIYQLNNPRFSFQDFLLNSLTQKYVESKSEIVLQEIGVIVHDDRNCVLPAFIVTELAKLSLVSPLQMYIQELVKDYNKTSSPDSLAIMQGLIVLESSITIPSSVEHLLEKPTPNPIEPNELKAAIPNNLPNIEKMISEYKMTMSRHSLNKVVHLTLSDPFLVLPPIITYIAFLHLNESTDLYLQDLLQVYDGTKSLAVLWRIEELRKFNSSLFFPINVIIDINNMQQRDWDHGINFGEVYDFSSYQTCSSSFPLNSDSLKKSERANGDSYLQESLLPKNAGSYPQNEELIYNLESNDYVLRKLIIEYETTQLKPVILKIIALALPDPYIVLNPFIAYIVFSSLNQHQGASSQYLQDLVELYLTTKSVAVLTRIEQLLKFDSSLEDTLIIRNDIISLGHESFLYEISFDSESEEIPLSALPQRSNEVKIPSPGLSSPLYSMNAGESEAPNSKYKQELISYLIHQYELTNSELVLIVIFEIIRVDPSVTLPLSSSLLLFKSIDKQSEKQQYVDGLVTKYFASSSVDILEEIGEVLSEFPHMYVPSFVSQAMISHSENLFLAEEQLKILSAKYHLSHDCNIATSIEEKLKTLPSLPIPASIAIDMIEILSEQSIISSSDKDSDDVDMGEKIVVDQQRVRQRLPSVSSAIILQQLVAEYSQRQTIENLVKIFRFTKYHPELHVSSFIAKRIASIAHLTEDELLLKILYEKYAVEPSPKLLSEIHTLSITLTHVPVPASIAGLLNKPQTATSSYLDDQLLLESLMRQYYIEPSPALIYEIACILAIKPHLHVPPPIAKLLAQHKESFNDHEVMMRPFVTYYMEKYSILNDTSYGTVELIPDDMQLKPHFKEHIWQSVHQLLLSGTLLTTKIYYLKQQQNAQNLLDLVDATEIGNAELEKHNASDWSMRAIRNIVMTLLKEANLHMETTSEMFDNMRNRGFDATDSELNYFWSNVRLSSSCLARVESILEAVALSNKLGVATTADFFKTILDILLLQEHEQYLVVDYESRELIPKLNINANFTRRYILSLIMPSWLDLMENEVVAIENRFGSFYSSLFKLTTVDEVPTGSQDGALLIHLESIHSLVSTLTEQCKGLIIENRKILSQDSYVVSEANLEVYIQNEFVALQALAASSAITTAMADIFIDRIGLASVRFFSEKVKMDNFVTVIDREIELLIFNNLEAVGATSEVAFYNVTEWHVDDKMDVILRFIVSAYQANLQGLVNSSRKNLDEIATLIKVLSTEITVGTGAVFSVAKYADFLKSCWELIEIPTLEASSILEENQWFVDMALNKNFKIPYSEFVSYMTNVNVALVKLSWSTGAAKAMLTALGVIPQNLGHISNLLLNILEDAPAYDGPSVLLDDLIKRLSSDILPSQTILADMLLGWQLILEKEVNMTYARLNSLESLIVTESGEQSTNSALALIVQTLIRIKKHLDEINSECTENRKTLTIYSSVMNFIPETEILQYIKKISHLPAALGHLAGSTVAIAKSYSEGKLTAEKTSKIFAKVMSIDYHQQSFDDSFYGLLVKAEEEIMTSIALREMCRYEIAFLDESMRIAYSRLNDFDFFLLALIPESESIDFDIVHAFSNILNFARNCTSRASYLTSQIKQRLSATDCKFPYKSDLGLVSDLYKELFEKIGHADGAIRSAVVAFSSGKFNSSSFWHVVREITTNEGVAEVFDSLSAVVSSPPGDDSTRLVLSIILPKSLILLEEQIIESKDNFRAVTKIAGESLTTLLSANTFTSQRVAFGIETIVTLIRNLIEKAEDLYLINFEIVKRASRQGFDLNYISLEEFMDNKVTALRCLAKASGACEVVANSGFTDSVALQHIAQLILGERLFYDLKERIAGESFLRLLVVQYSLSRAFSILKQINQYMSVYREVIIPEEILQEIKRLGLNQESYFSEEHILLQLIEDYIEVPQPDTFQKLSSLIPKHPQIKLPTQLLDQLIVERNTIKSEDYLKELVHYYSNHSTPEVVALIGELIESYPDFPLSLPIILHLLQQGIVTEVVLLHLIRQFRLSYSYDVLELISVVHYQFHADYELPTDILQAFYEEGILVRTECYYRYLLQMNPVHIDSRTVSHIGELIEIFSNIQVPSFFLQQLVHHKIITRTVFKKTVELYGQEPSSALLKIIADLSPLYSDFELPKNIIELMNDLRVAEEIESRESYLLQLVESYQKNFSIDALSEIFAMSEAMPNTDLPDFVKEQILLYSSILQASSTAVSATTLFPLIIALRKKYPQLPIPLQLQKELAFYEIVKRFEEIFSMEDLQEIAELYPLFPNMPLSTDIQQQIHMLKLIDLATRGEGSTAIITQIKDLSARYPHIPVHNDVQNRVRFLLLMNKFLDSELTSAAEARQIAEWSAQYPEIPVHASVGQVVLLYHLIDEVVNSKFPSILQLLQIEELSKTYYYVHIPDEIKTKIILIRDYDRVLNGVDISVATVEEMEELSLKFPSVIPPENVSQLILLWKLTEEAARLGKVSYSNLLLISQISSNFPNFPVTMDVKEQARLVELIEQVIKEDEKILEKTLDSEFKQIALLSAQYPHITLPTAIQNNIHCLQLLDAYHSKPSMDTLTQICELSRYVFGFSINSSIVTQCRLLDLIQEASKSYALSDVLDEIELIYPLYPTIVLPDVVEKQLLLRRFLNQVEKSPNPAELLDKIDEIYVSLPLYPIPPPILAKLISHREINQLMHLAELAQVNATTEMLQRIEELSRLHHDVHLPENVHFLVLQHIQEMYFKQLLEEVLTSDSPSKSILEEIDFLSHSINDAEIPPEVKAMIERYHQEQLLQQLIFEVQTSPTPSPEMIQMIWEMSQELPWVTLPKNVAELLLLDQLMKNPVPDLEALKTIRQLTKVYQSAEIPIEIQHKLFFLEQIEEALLSSAPSNTLLRAIAEKSKLYEMEIPEEILQQINAMNLNLRLEQLLNSVEHSLFPSASDLKEIREISKVATAFTISPTILLLMRTQELTEIIIEGGPAAYNALKELASILPDVPNAPILPSIRQQIDFIKVIEEAQKFGNTTRDKLEYISKLSPSYPHIPLPDSFKLMIKKLESPPAKFIIPSTEPTNAVSTQLQQLVTMYYRIPSHLILQKIAQLYATAQNFPLPENVTQALFQYGLISSESAAPQKLHRIQISSVFVELRKSFLEIMPSPQIFDVESLKRREVVASNLVSESGRSFEQSKNTLWLLRDSVRASGHPMHRTTLSIFDKLLNKIHVLIAQARDNSAYILLLFEKELPYIGDNAEVSVKIGINYVLLGKIEGALETLKMEVKIFSQGVLKTNENVIGKAANMKENMQMVVDMLNF